MQSRRIASREVRRDFVRGRRRPEADGFGVVADWRRYDVWSTGNEWPTLHTVSSPFVGATMY